MAGKGEGGSHPRMTAGFPTSSSRPAEEQEGVKESAQQMASQLGESAEQMREKAQEMWRGAREGLQEGWSRVSERAEDIWGNAGEFIRRHPLASLAAAFGLGCLISAALIAASRSSTEEMAERMSRSSS